MDFSGALIQVAHLVDSAFAEGCRVCGLTAQQGKLLCQLNFGPMGMGCLSRKLDLEKSSVSGLVDRVERQGLVKRVRDPHDRRAWAVELTDTGQRMAHRTHEEIGARIGALGEALKPAEREALTRFVADMAESRNAPAF
jgi:DNA-binding MarR family transcriptional regulator